MAQYEGFVPSPTPSPGSQAGTPTGTFSGQHQQPQQAVKPKQRARRGQATDPHSIAERLRRERIAERMKSLQDLVPNANRVDKASMLDEIIEYVRFLQLQVKVLSLSRLNGTAAEAVRQLMDELEKETGMPGEQPLSEVEIRDAERQVALLLETDMGSAMQYLQSKGLCLMPAGLAGETPSADTRSLGASGNVKPDPEDLLREDVMTFHSVKQE